MGRADEPSILTLGSSQIVVLATDTEWQSECDDWMLFRPPGPAEDARAPTSIEQAAGRLGDDQILPRGHAQDGRISSAGCQDGIPLPLRIGK